jgi:hypothetical protein
MGLFDTVICEHPLPDACPEREFQTKSLGCTMSRYRLGAGGRFIDSDGLDTGLHGVLHFYGGSRATWWEYEAKFSDGQLVHLLPAAQARYDADGLLRRPASATDTTHP